VIVLPKQITKKHVKEVCGLGQGEKTCSFLSAGGDGFTCAKGTSIEDIINQRRTAGTMKAKGDNCQGRKGAVSFG